jgi:alcohol dehydrogenase (cytochrome c)
MASPLQSASLETAKAESGGRTMTINKVVRSIRIFLLASVVCTLPASAAEVTSARLVNADSEPHNWLMNHRTYDGQHYSPLARINKDTIRNLRLAYAVPLGGSTGNEFSQSTPLVEDGFIYTVDSRAVVYKIDVTSGTFGRIMWRMDPKQERNIANRGSLCGAILSSQ